MWRGPRLPGDARAAEPRTAFLSQLDSGGVALSLVKLAVDFSFFDLYIVEVHFKGDLSGLPGVDLVTDFLGLRRWFRILFGCLESRLGGARVVCQGSGLGGQDKGQGALSLVQFYSEVGKLRAKRAVGDQSRLGSRWSPDAPSWTS